MVTGLALLIVAGLVIIDMSAGTADGAATAENDEGEAAQRQESRSGEPAGEDAGEEGDEEAAPVPVEVVEVAVGEISSYITSTANLVAEHQVRVLAEVEGRVARLLVEEGDSVRGGQPLADLVRDDAEIALKKAQLREANARMAWERGEGLMARELISREEHDKFTMEYQIARQELAEAEWRLAKTIIRAPFAGRVSERMIQPGQHVRPGDALFQVTDLDPLITRIYLPERDVLGLQEGRPVKIGLNADLTVRFDGRIRQISPIVDTSTGTVKVTIEAIRPPREVRPGSFVTVAVVRETHSNTALIPRESVLRELKGAHIFVAAKDKARKREVELGIEEGDRIEVLAGVEPGEQVIVAGQGGLKDGSPVKILPSESAQPAG